MTCVVFMLRPAQATEHSAAKHQSQDGDMETINTSNVEIPAQVQLNQKKC